MAAPAPRHVLARVTTLVLDDALATCDELASPEPGAPFRLAHPPRLMLRDELGSTHVLPMGQLPLATPFVWHALLVHADGSTTLAGTVPEFDATNAAIVCGAGVVAEGVALVPCAVARATIESTTLSVAELVLFASYYLHHWPALTFDAPQDYAAAPQQYTAAMYLEGLCHQVESNTILPLEAGDAASGACVSAYRLAYHREATEDAIMGAPAEARRDASHRWHLATCRALRYYLLDVFTANPHHTPAMVTRLAHVLSAPRSVFERRVARSELIDRLLAALYGERVGELFAVLVDRIVSVEALLGAAPAVGSVSLAHLQALCEAVPIHIDALVRAAEAIRIEWCVYGAAYPVSETPLTRLLARLEFYAPHNAARSPGALILREAANDVHTIVSLFARLSEHNKDRRANMRLPVTSDETLVREITGQNVVVLLDPGGLASESVVDPFAARCAHVYASTAVDLLADSGARAARLPVILVRACHWRSVHGLAELVRHALAYGPDGRPCYDTERSPHYTLVFEFDPLMVASHVGRLFFTTLFDQLRNANNLLHVLCARSTGKRRQGAPLARHVVALKLVTELGWWEDPRAALANTVEQASWRATDAYARAVTRLLLPSLADAAARADSAPIVVHAGDTPPPTNALLLSGGAKELYERHFTGRLTPLPTDADITYAAPLERFTPEVLYALSQATNGRVHLVESGRATRAQLAEGILRRLNVLPKQ